MRITQMLMKLFLHTPIALLLLLMAGCAAEVPDTPEVPNTPDPPDSKGLSNVEAYIAESMHTKAYLKDNSILEWDLDEKIGIFSDTDAAIPFTRTGKGNSFSSNKTIRGNQYYAFYPFFKDVFNPKAPDILYFGAEIKKTAGGKSPTLQVPMIAKSNGSAFSFKITCGILHYAITGSKELASVTLRGNDSEPIPRSYRVNLNDEVPVLAGVWDGSTEMKHTLESPVQLSETEPYDVYFILPPMCFEYGFTIVLNYGGEFVSHAVETEVTVARADIVNYSLNVDEFIEEEKKIMAKERDALVSIYNALGGPNWIHKENWCSDRPVGEWYGVATDEEGYVSSLDFSDNNLSGTLPEELGSFKRLRVLVIEDNSEDKRIKGSLPDALANCVHLAGLVFSGIDMSSALPEWIENLKELQTLSFVDCNLIGSLPKLSSEVISDISLNNNHLTGPIPVGYGELEDLCILNLSNNELSGEVTADFSGCSHLIDFKLCGNQLTGSLPKIPVESTEILYLYDNYFTGPIPEDYARILDHPDSDNTHIRIHTNNLSGPLPDAILYHPNFSEYADQILRGQREGYKFDFDETKVPACKHVFKTLDGETLDLGARYALSDYTMIVRWAEWCPFAYVFTPQAIELAKKYKDKGLQTIWAYGGGIKSERIAYMAQVGLDHFSPHIIESLDPQYFNPGPDHAVWRVQRYSTPFVEVVDRDGHILFLDDSGKDYSAYTFSHPRDELGAFLNELLGGSEDELYESTDYSADGAVHTIQTAQEGAGINIVLMGDAYSDRLIADGTYEKQMRRAADAFFFEEPFASFKDFFNVYYIDVVSKNETYEGDIAFSSQFGEGTSITGDNDKVYEYAHRVLSDDEMDDAVVILIINRDYMAGTTSMRTVQSGDYGRGPGIAYCPAVSHSESFVSIVSHEAGGHAFGKLGDEYSYGGTIDGDTKAQKYEAMVPYGWWKNIDFTNDLVNIKWSDFVSDDRYKEEKLGAYEGAVTFSYGVWRPTDNSIMNDSLTGFNAPSRYAIWYRIGKMVYGFNWAGTYEEFVTWDHAHRPTSATTSTLRTNRVEKPRPLLAPPVVEFGSWRK